MVDFFWAFIAAVRDLICALFHPFKREGEPPDNA